MPPRVCTPAECNVNKIVMLPNLRAPAERNVEGYLAKLDNHGCSSPLNATRAQYPNLLHSLHFHLSVEKVNALRQAGDPTRSCHRNLLDLFR